MITQRQLDQAKINARRKLRMMKQKAMYRYLGERLEYVAPMLVGEARLPEAPRAPELVPGASEDVERDLGRLAAKQPQEPPVTAGATY